MSEFDVLIIGGGISGLNAAKELYENDKKFLILEKTGALGGRIRTDRESGFQLDRGFQILLPGYEEAQDALDYHTLDLRYFTPGVRIWLEKRWQELRDPLDAPWKSMKGLFSSVGSLNDKLGMIALSLRSQKGTLQGRPELSTEEYLKKISFSEKIIGNFFQPFLKGVFLEQSLSRSSSEFAFYFSHFANTGGALPSRGMESIPLQLAESIPEESVRTDATVQAVTEGKVTLATGEELYAPHIILAVDQSSALELLPKSTPYQKPKIRGTMCMYFTGAKRNEMPPLIHLVPQSRNGIANIAPLSAVASEYAPPENCLFSVNITLDESFNGTSPSANEIKEELIELFGDAMQEATHLKTYTIPYALPSNNTHFESNELPKGVYLAGDWALQGSINGALQSGRLAVENILRATL